MDITLPESDSALRYVGTDHLERAAAVSDSESVRVRAEEELKCREKAEKEDNKP